MSIPQNTLIGKTRRSIGNVTFSTWKGINIMKSKPITVANPRTDKQQQQRDAQKQMVFLARNISAAIKLGFNQLAIGMSAYNAFLSYNLKNAFDMSQPPVATLDPLKLLVSKGTIASTPIVNIVATAGEMGGTITMQGGALQPGQSLSDQLCLVFIDWNSFNYSTVINLGTRAQNGHTFSLSTSFNYGTEIIVYAFYVSADGKRSSTSVWNSVTFHA